jgi:hypothetical protein
MSVIEIYHQQPHSFLFANDAEITSSLYELAYTDRRGSMNFAQLEPRELEGWRGASHSARAMTGISTL